jgi:hypothetical protein
MIMGETKVMVRFLFVFVIGSVTGTIIHSLFEMCAAKTDFSDVFAAKQMEALLPSFLERLYGVHKTENDV